MKLPDWLKRAGQYTAVFGALGILWSAAQWCQHTTDILNGQSAQSTAIIKRLDAMQPYITYQSRQIYTLDANRGLMNRYVKAPQIPMPEPDASKQQDSHPTGQSQSEPYAIGENREPITTSNRW